MRNRDIVWEDLQVSYLLTCRAHFNKCLPPTPKVAEVYGFVRLKIPTRTASHETSHESVFFPQTIPPQIVTRASSRWWDLPTQPSSSSAARDTSLSTGRADDIPRTLHRQPSLTTGDNWPRLQSAYEATHPRYFDRRCRRNGPSGCLPWAIGLSTALRWIIHCPSSFKLLYKVFRIRTGCNFNIRSYR